MSFNYLHDLDICLIHQSDFWFVKGKTEKYISEWKRKKSNFLQKGARPDPLA
jgi:hypothetical protein